MVTTGSPARQASAQTLEMRKLALVESSTMARVLSDLRILQSAFANLQGQVANLPPRSDLENGGAKVLHGSGGIMLLRAA